MALPRITQKEMTEQGELVRGLPVRLILQKPAIAELHLGEQAKFFPTDAALASWTAQADGGKAAIQYD